MIPYVILLACPNGPYTNFSNIDVSYYFCKEKDELQINILNEIVEFMYEFCSIEYGYGITITSYSDFCDKWWKKKENRIDDVDIFEIKYFENGEWKEWKTNDYEEEIFNHYKCKVNKTKE
jgi:hypothetical protein